MSRFKRSIIVLLSVATLALGLTTAVTVAASPASATTYCESTYAGAGTPSAPYLNSVYFIDGVTYCSYGGNQAVSVQYTCIQVYAYWNGVWNWVNIDGQCNNYGETADWGTAQTGRWMYRTATYSDIAGGGWAWRYSDGGYGRCIQYSSASPAHC